LLTFVVSVNILASCCIGSNATLEQRALGGQQSPSFIEANLSPLEQGKHHASSL
jgi:hypothetical protein